MRVAAVDLGATSARVAVVDGDALTVVHRYAHQPVVDADGALRWDWTRLMGEVEHGLDAALAVGPLDSIGVDTWGVDYGLLGGDGALVAPPFSYRDARTAGWRDVVTRIGELHLYRTTGIQLLPFNTVFQLAAHRRDELDRAAILLMLPELVVHHLTGIATAERTSAGTTALVSLATGTWDHDLLRAIGVDPALFPTILPAGTPVGEWRDVPVRLVGGHDTASAVAARPGPASADRAFVSTGTWVIVGTELDEPVTSEAARRANFSNERAVDGRIRFVKNVTGFWLLEQCRVAWGDPPIGPLVAAAAERPDGGPLVHPDDPAFAGPIDMAAAVAAAAGLPGGDRAAIVRCIVDSIAAAAARLVGELEDVTGTAVAEADVFGGGVKNQLFLDRVADALGDRPLTVGPAEATALGNARVQLATR